MTTCEVCNKNDSVGVAAIPGVPMSCAFCAECLEANAIPWWAAVANTACCGGLGNTAPWWRHIVFCTCNHLGKSLAEFTNEVNQLIIYELTEMKGGED